MASTQIIINTYEDLAQLNGWRIEDFRYDAVQGRLVLEIGNLLAPNRVRIYMQQQTQFGFPQPGLIVYTAQIGFTTEDIIPTAEKGV